MHILLQEILESAHPVMPYQSLGDKIRPTHSTLRTHDVTASTVSSEPTGSSLSLGLSVSAGPLVPTLETFSTSHFLLHTEAP